MPELPEVETTRRGLLPHVAGRTIEQVTVREPRLRWPVPRDLSQRLAGARVAGIERRGKYLLFRIDARFPGWLLVHLGMSGSLRIVPADTPPGPHDHVDLRLDTGRLLRLRDPRRFGAVLWHAGEADRHPLLAHQGVEPLSPAFTGGWLYDRTRSREAAIKPVLMDAGLVVGVGNIYANEALFQAGIDPRLPARRLGRARCARLVEAVRETLTRAIEAGGSSLRDFVDADGQPGYFQHQYAVYGRAGEPCRRCGGPVRHLRQGNRSTFFCPRCQR